MTRTGVGVVVAALGVALCAPARAENNDASARAAARKLGYEGVDAYQAGDFATATDKLERAYSVLHVPSLGVWSARALVKVGKLIEATDRYVEVARLPLGGGDFQVQKAAQNDAQSELEATQKLTPTLVVQLSGVQPAAAQVSVDGTPLASNLIGEANPINPGHHRIEGVAGDAHALLEIDVQLREEKKVTLGLTPSKGNALAPSQSGAHAATNTSVDAAPSSLRWRRTAGFVALGVGAAGLVVGGVTGVMALSKRSQLDKNPDCAADHLCPAEETSNVNSLNTLRSVSTVGFVAGGVLAAAGFVLVLTAPSAKASSTALWVSPTSAGLRGSF